MKENRLEPSIDCRLLELSDSPKPLLSWTSVVDRVRGALADHLTGRTHGQDRLEGLARANVFVVSLGGRDEWFSHQALLRELIRHRLHLEQPEAETQVHRHP
jgi:ATP/maltotriose-dependent transcriptional regulator MalT